MVSPAAAGDFELGGHVAGDLRLFPSTLAHDGQDSTQISPSLVLEPEFLLTWNQADDQLVLTPFLRVDSVDDERTHWDIREFMYLHATPDWEVRAGIGKLFWGVTEANHLVDIVNQTDAIEDIDGEDKLGQPMVRATLVRDWGYIDLFALPGFRERTYPDAEGRLRGPIPVNTDRATYESGAGSRHVDLAARTHLVIDDWDIGLSHFHGTSREPRLVVEADSSGTAWLIPHYDIIDQTGADIQATLDTWLLKFEGIYRSGHEKSFPAATGGVEYTFYGVDGEALDLGLVVEYMWDGRGVNAPRTPLDDDLFTGLRLTLNDEDNTNLLAGVLVDRNSGGRTLSAEASTRLNPNWTLELDARFLDGYADDQLLYGFRRDSHVQIRLARYF